jgi:hypothetical protein
VRRRALHRVGEAEERELAGALVEELRALLEVVRPGVHRHAEPFKQRQVDRQQRLADVKPRELLALEHHHAAPRLGQQVGRRRTSRSAADDHRVEAPHAIPPFTEITCPVM